MTAIRDAARVGDGNRSFDAADEALSFDALYRAFAADLEAFCVRRLGNLHDGQDAAHEVLLRAATGTWRGEASLRWWLGTIARNVCTDFARRRRRELPLGLPTTPFRVPDDSPRRRSSDESLEPAEPGTVEEIAERRARGRLVRQAVAALPPRERHYLELSYFDGLTHSDIAGLDDTTPSAVHGRLFRARERLRAVIEGLGPRDRLWPLPVLVTSLPRLRAQWANLRARVNHTFLEYTASSSVPLGAVLGHSAIHAVVAVVGSVGLTLAGSDTPAEPSVARTDLRVPIVVAYDTPDPRTQPSAVPRAAPSPPAGSARAVAPDARDRAAGQPASEDVGSTPLSGAANPTVESNAEDVVSEPVHHRDSSDIDPGYETTAPTVSIDRDDDGEPEHDDDGPSTGLSCGNPAQHGTVTSLLCETSEMLSEDPAGI